MQNVYKMAASDDVCVVCSRKFFRNSRAIQCSECVKWCHKGCSGLTTIEFDNFSRLTKKHRNHGWICTACRRANESSSLNCKQQTADRRSLSITDKRPSLPPSGHVSVNTAILTGNANMDARVTSPSTSGRTASLVNDFSRNISSLLDNSDVGIKDVIILMQQMLLQLIGAVTEQYNATQNVLGEIKNIQEGVISQLQAEIVMLREEVERIKLSAASNINSPKLFEVLGGHSSIFTEVQDRASRSSNIMVYNLVESKSTDVQVRISHDNNKMMEVFQKINAETGPFKAIRVGKIGSREIRPLKIVLSSADLVKSCFRNKYKLRESEVRLGPDLTKNQREHLSKLHEEKNNRIASGEEGLVIKYRNGVPFISKGRSSLNSQSKNG